MSGIRPATLAGAWYPGSPDTLSSDVDGYLDLADKAKRPAGRPLLAVVPHAGFSYSGPSAGCLYGLLRDFHPRTVIILAPNHRKHLENAALSSADAFQTPLGEVAVDTEAVLNLKNCPTFIMDDHAHTNEHAVEIHLPFLQRVWPQNTPSIVPVLIPCLAPGPRAEAARALADIASDDTLLIVSTDFTHYGTNFGFTPFAEDIPDALERLDAGAILKILAGDSSGLIDYGQKTGITMCGLHAAALALDRGLPSGYEAALVDYRRSGDKDRDYSLSVSYASILITTGPGRPANSGS